MQPGRKSQADSRFTQYAAELGRAVRSARDAAEMTQQQLADRAATSVSWVSKLETGKIIEPGLFPILAVLRVVGVTDLDDVLRAVTPGIHRPEPN